MLFTVRFLNEQGFLQFLHSPVHIYTALPLLLHISFLYKKKCQHCGGVDENPFCKSNNINKTRAI